MLKSVRCLFSTLAVSVLASSVCAEDAVRLDYVSWGGGSNSNIPLLNTGVVPNNLTTVEVKFQYASGSGERTVFCARAYNEDSSSDTRFYTFSAFCFNGAFRFDYNTSQAASGGTVSSTDPQVVRMGWDTSKNAVACFVDDTQIGSNISGAYFRAGDPEDKVGAPLCLFGACRYRFGQSGNARFNNINSGLTGKIYYCRIYNNGTLTHEFVPFRSQNGTVGMIDTVNNPSMSESKFIQPVQGALTAGPVWTCMHDLIAGNICQHCHKNVRDLGIELVPERAGDTMTFSGSLGAFGLKAQGQGDADSVGADLQFVELGQPLATVESLALTNLGEFAFTTLTIDPDKTYQWKVVFTNNAPSSPVTKTFEGFSAPPNAYTSDFLNGLAALGSRVAGSPYATGGDIILREDGDYIHIFCSTNGPRNFTILNRSLVARVLLVGGGGGGGAGKGGGGGGGGVKDEAVFGLLANTNYTVVVGIGGNGGTINSNGTSATKGESGGDSSILLDENVLTVAKGGGFGGAGSGGAPGPNSKGGDGGNGGGGGCSGAEGGLPLDASTGFAGGKGGYNSSGEANGYCSAGGGGGAGGPGASPPSQSAVGVGGDALSVDILGAGVMFAKGGNGGTYPQGPDAVPGEDGRGNGGTGGNGNCNFGFTPGAKGGNGIVIVRYPAPTDALAINLTDLAPTNDATATVNWLLLGPGTYRVSAKIGLTIDDLPVSVPLDGNAAEGAGSAVISGLLPGRKYYLSLHAEDDGGQSVTTTPVAFTMDADGAFPEHPFDEVPAIRTFIVKDRTGTNLISVAATLEQAGTGSAFDNCSALFKWGTQNDYNQMVFSNQTVFSAEGFCELPATNLQNVVYYGCFEVENLAGLKDRIFFSFTPVDTRTYSWKDSVPEGNWKDRANWTTPDGSPEWAVGYPTGGATADFTSANCATVHVAGVIRCLQVKQENADATYVFVGDNDDAAIMPTASVTHAPRVPNGGTLVFDHVRTYLRAGGTSSYGLSGSAKLVLKNGANVEVRRSGDDNTTEGFVMTSASSSLEIYDGSHLLARPVQIAGNVTVGGTASEIAATSMSGLFAKSSDASITCMIPREGWQTAPFRAPSHKFGWQAYDSGFRDITFNVPFTAPLWDADADEAAESLIVNWANGIDVSKVKFGRAMKRADYFYFTSTNELSYVFCTDGSGALATLGDKDTPLADPPMMTKLWYHHYIRRGTMINIR